MAFATVSASEPPVAFVEFITEHVTAPSAECVPGMDTFIDEGATLPLVPPPVL